LGVIVLNKILDNNILIFYIIVKLRRKAMVTVTKEDYYKILGVDRNADEKEIKKAFRRLARKYHPDVNPGDKAAEQRFKEINEAYEILIDPKKRADYDRFGHAAFEPGFGAGPGPGFETFREGFEFQRDFGFGDIFGDLFGRRAERVPTRGEDLIYSLEISLEDAVFGASPRITLNREVLCSQCGGNGIQPGTSVQNCTDCRGTGQISSTRGFFSFSQPCPKCKGTGKINVTPCKACGGRGKTIKTETISVNIPPGVEDGSKVRVAGMGGAGERGGPPGDLFIITKIRPHPFFERKGDDLYCEIPISMSEAVLGAKIEIPTIDGMASMVIPQGTNSGQRFRLKGKGVPHLKGAGRGDQYCSINIVGPKVLDEKARELFRELNRLHPENPRSSITYKGSRRT
jgi:molecular chaperone DnaJ